MVHFLSPGGLAHVSAVQLAILPARAKGKGKRGVPLPFQVLPLPFLLARGPCLPGAKQGLSDGQVIGARSSESSGHFHKELLEH